MEKEFVEKLISVVPTERQVEIQRMGYYNFIHFGLNTFTDREWGSGNDPLSAFDIENLDTDKWCKALSETGSKGVILTAKHHDGFCLFPSKYTDYSIKNTKYRNGKGDIVKQLSLSVKKYNLKMGLYLSPWDRHETTYGTEEYNDYFCKQLTELCTNYGEIFCFWFDGACGEGKNGRKQRYDWLRYYEIIRRLQPNACISNCGEDVRWIGNEGGRARTAEWSVVPKRLQEAESVAEKSQTADNYASVRKMLNTTDENLGSRERLQGEDKICWWPAEMDVSVTKRGWFYHKKSELFYTRDARQLVKFYFDSVGNNAMLLLNVPPNKKGELPDKFVNRMKDAKNKIEKIFSKKALCAESGTPYERRLSFQTDAKIRAVVLGEDITQGQRVESFVIEANGKIIYRGETIGFKKICLVSRFVKEELYIKILSSRGEPKLNAVKVYLL